MAKFRSYFASDLDYLKASIIFLLAQNSQSQVDLSSFDLFCKRLEDVYSLVHNRSFNDLIRKK